MAGELQPPPPLRKELIMAKEEVTEVKEAVEVKETFDTKLEVRKGRGGYTFWLQAEGRNPEYVGALGGDNITKAVVDAHAKKIEKKLGL